MFLFVIFLCVHILYAVLNTTIEWCWVTLQWTSSRLCQCTFLGCHFLHVKVCNKWCGISLSLLLFLVTRSIAFSYERPEACDRHDIGERSMVSKAMVPNRFFSHLDFHRPFFFFLCGQVRVWVEEHLCKGRRNALAYAQNFFFFFPVPGRVSNRVRDQIQTWA